VGIFARVLSVELRETIGKAVKHMATEPPCRIAKLEIVFTIPLPSDHPQRKLLEAAAKGCPVHLSLHPDVVQDIRFDWVG